MLDRRFHRQVSIFSAISQKIILRESRLKTACLLAHKHRNSTQTSGRRWMLKSITISREIAKTTRGARDAAFVALIETTP